MADTASSLIGASLSGSSSTSSTLDQLVAAYKQSRQSEVDTLTSKEKTLENKQTFYGTLRTKINSLISGLDNLVRYDSSDKYDPDYISTVQDKFNAKTVTSSDSEYVTATATGSAAKGVNLIKVDRLATNDVLVTKQMNLSDAFGISGEKTFTFNTKGTDDEANTNLQVKVTFDGTETNEQALKKIVSAINAQDEHINFSASLIKDSSTTGRLTFTSKNSGADNQINLVSADSDVKAALGLDALGSNSASRNPATVDKKGAYFRVSNVTDLNSQFELNGIAVTRSSNSISDALDGFTINLLKKQDDSDSEVTLTSDYDMSKVESTITSFLDVYNDLVTSLTDNKATTQSESGVSNLLMKIRSVISEAVAPADAEPADLADDLKAPRYLQDIGIKVKSDGTLSLSDTDKLEKYLKLENGGDKIANLFDSENGVAAKLYNIVSPLVDDDGLIKSRTLSLSTQIDSAKDKITSAEDRIDKAAEAMRKQYQSVLSSYLKAQSQYSLLSTMPSSSSSSSSLLNSYYSSGASSS